MSNKIKISDYIAEFIASKKVKHTFVVTGGCIIHTIDSISKRNDIDYIPVCHEQAGAMAADSYARLTNNIGVALATSGPGATNLLTGVLCSYYDSVPTMIITGQVPSGQLKRKSKSRQIGFQETDVVSIYKTATKYSVMIDNPDMIRYELEKAYHIATTGRKGPVLIDICDDVQRAEIIPENLLGFTENNVLDKNRNLIKSLKQKVLEIDKLIEKSDRPVVILGGGVRLSGCINESLEFAESLDIPIVPTWGALDILPHNHPLFVGPFGVSSGRAGNFTVQNSDLIICIGTRLDTHETGPNLSSFGRGAKKIMVDIDNSEIEKFKNGKLKIDIGVVSDVNDFLLSFKSFSKAEFQKSKLDKWKSNIVKWKEKYPPTLPKYYDMQSKVNPYVFMKELSGNLSKDDIILTDCGANLIWTMQAMILKDKQRLISAFNHSPMGYSLPASIGAAFATHKKIFCITGDGGLQMNIQELGTIVKNNLNIIIILLNNHGHGIIRNTQETWLDGKYNASTPDSGLPDPDYIKIAKAYGLTTININSHKELKKIETISQAKGPLFCNVELLGNQKMIPKLKFGKPIEDSDPLLSREEFNENMIINIIDE